MSIKCPVSRTICVYMKINSWLENWSHNKEWERNILPWLCVCLAAPPAEHKPKISMRGFYILLLHTDMWVLRCWWLRERVEMWAYWWQEYLQYYNYVRGVLVFKFFVILEHWWWSCLCQASMMINDHTKVTYTSVVKLATRGPHVAGIEWKSDQSCLRENIDI